MYIKIRVQYYVSLSHLDTWIYQFFDHLCPHRIMIIPINRIWHVHTLLWFFCSSIVVGV